MYISIGSGYEDIELSSPHRGPMLALVYPWYTNPESTEEKTR